MKRMLSVLLFFIFLWPDGIWAHAFPTHSEPKVGSEIKEPPASVKIWFDGDLEPVFSSMKVFGPDGKQVDAKDAKVDEEEQNLLIIPLPQLGPGQYQVKWGVVAKDGHRTEGDFTFQLK